MRTASEDGGGYRPRQQEQVRQRLRLESLCASYVDSLIATAVGQITVS